MNIDLYNEVKAELCPDGNWKMNGTLERILNRQINHFPKRETSDEETRYPEDQTSMRAFLDKFFFRHYFQVQNSLLEYMASEEFIDLIKIGRLNILDIGSGPAVASMAITDILVCVLKNLNVQKIIRISYFLNDPVNICLGAGKDFLNSYFLSIKKSEQKLCNNIVLTIEKDFPSNVKQLMRIRRNYGEYGIVNFSYVITPLQEQKGLTGIKNGFLEIELMCNPKGRILILQDKFKEALIRKITSAIGERYKKQELSQYVYSSNNSNEIQTYTYFDCIYSPQSNGQGRAIAV